MIMMRIFLMIMIVTFYQKEEEKNVKVNPMLQEPESSTVLLLANETNVRDQDLSETSNDNAPAIFQRYLVLRNSLL